MSRKIKILLVIIIIILAMISTSCKSKRACPAYGEIEIIK